MTARFFALVAAFAALVVLVRATDVIHATKDNWDTLVKPLDLTLVEFFAPWCGHCKNLAPKYEAAATQLKDIVPLVSVDCTVESELCKQFEVRGYPTLKVFRNNVPTDYQGQRETDAIVRFLKKQKQPSITEIDETVFNQLIETEKVVVVAFMKESDELHSAFKDAAEKLRLDFTFALLDAPLLATAHGATQPAIVLFKKFDDGKNVYTGANDAEEIEKFVKVNAVPLMDDIGPDNYQSYADSGLPLAYLFVENDEQRKEYGPIVESVAKDFKGVVSFVYIDAIKFGGHAGNMNLKQVWPAFAIEHQKKKFPFDQSQTITGDVIKAFVENFLNGGLAPATKSEEIPESQDGPVTIVVNKQYKEIVEAPKDVLIEFYAPWCGHCKKLAPIYDELGAKLKPFSDKIVIAKMDATANDLPADATYEVKGFPTIKLVKADNSVMDFNGDRTVESFVQFLQQHAVHGKSIVFDQNASETVHAHEAEHDHDEL
jgi:protein disulfide-isomerase A1